MRLDRNAKRGIAALIFVLVATVLFMAWRSVVALTPDDVVAERTPETEDELIKIGDHTLLLEHGSATNRIAHWLHAGSADSEAFELGSASFTADTAALNPEGQRRVAAIASMMTHVRPLDAQILLRATPEERPLEEQRALSVRKSLVANGVSAQRIRISGEPVRGGKEGERRPEILIVLSH